jgi:photosystem II stability/assembly factor-like uncharacterized protein
MRKSYVLLIILFAFTITLNAQWKKLPKFTTNKINKCDFITLNFGVVVGDNGFVYQTTDGGANWKNISPDSSFNFTSIEIESDDTLFVSGYNSLSHYSELFATFDGGTSWQIINSYYVDESTNVKCCNNSLYFIGAWKGIQKSTDWGLNWKLISTGGGTLLLDNLKFDKTNPENLFVFGNVGGFFNYSCYFKHTLDNKWEGCDVFDFGSSDAYTAHFVINDTVLLFENHSDNFYINDTSNVLLMLYDFYRDDSFPPSASGDTVWYFSRKVINSDIKHYVKDFYLFNISGLGYSVDLVGNINKTTNGGVAWNKVYSGSDTLNSICMVSDTAGYVVGNNGTIIKLGLISTGVYEERGKNKIKIFELSQNYPNPFNPSTTFSFYLPKRSHATLKIFDLLGREVTTIVSEEMSAGNYYRQWNATNISSGIYFYRLQAGTFTETKKFILLR